MIKLKVSGKKRKFPEQFWNQLEGPKPPLDFESNGCSFSPDYILHYHIWPACHIHDWHYSEAKPLSGTWAGRREADQILRGNLDLCLKLQGASSFRRWRICYIYWGRVRIWGRSHYAFEDNKQPASLWQRFSEAWGWFRDKRPTTSGD